jgi:hypothetical protein
MGEVVLLYYLMFAGLAIAILAFGVLRRRPLARAAGAGGLAVLAAFFVFGPQLGGLVLLAVCAALLLMVLRR